MVISKMTKDKNSLTVDQFAQRAAAETRRRLLETEATEVEDEESLPDSATPKSNGSETVDSCFLDKSRVISRVFGKDS